MKYHLTLFLFLIISTFSFAQQNEAKSKAFYFSAQDAFKANNYDSALSLLEKSEEAGGASNAYIEALKAKCYAGKKDWVNTKQALEVCYTYSPGDDVLKDLSPIILQADTEYEKVIKAEQDRILAEQQAEMLRIQQEQEAQMAAIEKEQNRIKTANEHYDSAYNLLNSFKKLKEGVPYLIKTKTITDLDSEKSVFIFYGDKYIIYTIPNIGYVKNLFKDNIAFDPSVGDNAMQRVVKHKNSTGGKSESYFKRSPQYNNVFYSKHGMVWIGQQYTTFTDELYYYYINKNANTNYADDIDLYCDTDIKEDFGIYLNPYIKTGKILKGVNYDFIIDEDLKADYKSEGFQQVDLYEPVYLISAERETFSMLFPRKEVTYVMADDNAKDQNSAQKYLYFEEQGVKAHYGLINYKSFQKNAQGKLLLNIIGVNNDFIMSKEQFNSIYDAFNSSKDSSTTLQFFNNEAYTLPFEIITKIYGYFEPFDFNK
jgi:hypothetical protein